MNSAQTTTATKNANDIVITGIGMLTASGCGIETNLKDLTGTAERKTAEDYYIRGFNPAPFLSDRKVVKVVSARDVLGLVAFEDCVKNAGITKETINPDRTGLYVGAPPSACSDNLNYAEGTEATRDAYGALREAEFGNTFRTASPTTLLTGLPNNVLCYGSKTLDARGPNSNYTALETSAHLSVIGASRAMRLGRADCAIAGGYSAHTDRLYIASMTQKGLLKQPQDGKSFAIKPFQDDPGTITAEGAAFVSLETRDAAMSRGATPFACLLAGCMASDAKGPFAVDTNSEALTHLITRTLKQGHTTPDEIETVFLTGCGLSDVDQIERTAIAMVFEQNIGLPILVTTAPIWGNLMEAGGIAELGVLKHCYETGSIPASLRIDDAQNSRDFNPKKTKSLILRASPWGEYTCLLVDVEATTTATPVVG